VPIITTLTLKRKRISRASAEGKQHDRTYHDDILNIYLLRKVVCLFCLSH